MLCSVCNNGVPITDPESGEVVCSSCGRVLTDKCQDRRPKWHSFDAEKNGGTRTGPPISLTRHDMGLATVIGRANKDSSGRRLDSSARATMRRLRTWDFRTKANPNLVLAFDELSGLKAKLGLSNAIVEKTAYIYRKALEKQLIRGRSTSSVLVAAVYIACREAGASRTLREIAEITCVKRKEISRSYRVLVRELDIKVPLVDPMRLIATIANKARFSEKTKRMALINMDSIVEKGVSAGKNPRGIAATVLYMCCLKNGENVSQKGIAEVAGITEVTIRNNLNDLRSRAMNIMRFDYHTVRRQRS
jgi:transcription initiation factor TFIIB